MVVAMLGVGVVTVMASVAGAAPTVKGDTAAWTEIDAALTRLHALAGWRVKESQSGGRVVRELEFAPPNYHLTRRTPTATVEVFQVGGVTVSRSFTQNRPEARCRRLPRTRPLPPQDLREYMASGATGELTIGRKPDTSIGGVPVHAYTYVFQPSPRTMVRGDIFIGARTGLPLRSTSETPEGACSRETTMITGRRSSSPCPASVAFRRNLLRSRSA
jgi:hypothetical protein